MPAVENVVSGNAYRPGDVLRTRKGITVEVGNTDAEGRLVLADALALADTERPDLLVDLATLTGAARIALGAEASRAVRDPRRHVEAAAAPRQPAWRSPLAAALVERLRRRDLEQDRGREQRLGLDLRRRHHRRAVPAAIRHRGPTGCTSTCTDGIRRNGLEGR
jgi:hypothetical protein